MLNTFLAATRDRKRLLEIAGVLWRFGLTDLLNQMGLAFLLTPEAKSDDDPPQPVPQTLPQRVRAALTELGPVFVKLGQILATRADLLPEEWTDELSTLQSRVPVLPWQVVEAQIEEDLGAAPESVFSEFDRTPIAAASMAQVYRATLQSGQPVVVKVLRPGIRQPIEADLRLLAAVAALVQQHSKEVARYQPVDIVRHLSRALREELDLVNEGLNTDAVAANFVDDPDVVIPAIHWEFTSERLLVQDFLSGVAPGADGAVEAAGLDGRILAERGATAFLQMVMRDGLFHADPHPGNLLALPDNRVGFIDFGMVGRIGDKRRDQVLRFVGAMVRGTANGVSGVLLEWSASTETSLAKLDAGADGFIARHGNARLDLTQALPDLMALIRENHLSLPPDLVLLFKALATADGVMKRLDPDFNVIKVAEPVVRRSLHDQMTPQAIRSRLEGFAIDLLGAAHDAPSILKLLLHRLRQGRVAVDIAIEGTSRIEQQIERASTKLALAIIIAAFAVGLAPGLLQIGPSIYGIPLFAIIGVLTVLGGILWLLGMWFTRSKPK